MGGLTVFVMASLITSFSVAVIACMITGFCLFNFMLSRHFPAGIDDDKAPTCLCMSGLFMIAPSLCQCALSHDIEW
ncbi:MAG: hypothetical protein CL809_14910 [Cobetia sp.]|nr:hypothetical protein [Cobetia sp.]HBJ28718.1 hypothetical protein [Cobetia sp.]